MVKSIEEGRYRDGVCGAILTMTDGSRWFHPYNGGRPERMR